VLCLGGGAVLDVVGFAAATVHRGVRLVRLPTTTLAQADSGIGVKCGVNHRGKKNLLGVFAVPRAVVCDPTFCRTLSDADWRGGFAEAVKVALVRDATLFDRLQADAEAIAGRDEAAGFPVIERSAQLHLCHIAEGGDPFESGAARPLDMGHWAGHKLEQMTDFAVSHGQAVAIGLAIDLTYAAKVGMMAADQAGVAIDLLRRLGFAVSHPALGEVETLLGGLDEFREHLGGPLTLVMPAGVGRTQNVHEIEHTAMRQAIAEIAQTPGPGEAGD
jgi:3-dehydroquinate synthase